MVLSTRHWFIGLTAAALLLLSGCNFDGNNGNIRLVNASTDYSSLGVYVDNNPDISGVNSLAVSGYSQLSPDTNHTFSFTTAGVGPANALATITQSLPGQSHRTFVAYGDTGQFATPLVIDEDQKAPAGGSSSVEILNTAVDAGPVDVYLTPSGGGVSLNDTSATFSDVQTGTASSFQTIMSGSYELRVTATGSKTDLRLDLPSVTFNSGQVASVIIAGTQGGVLVHALILPQQGALVADTNPDARVRTAVGLSTGTSVTTTVGGVAILAAAPVATIGDYQLVPAGSQAGTVNVDGTSVTLPTLSFTGGADYTLLLWTNASGTQATLLPDSNRLPPSGDANVRLINAMSGLGDPLSLTINFEPAASSIALGNASTYSQVPASTTAALAVTDASTSASISSQSAVTLNTQDVYTLFVFGSQASPVTTLRQDR